MMKARQESLFGDDVGRAAPGRGWTLAEARKFAGRVCRQILPEYADPPFDEDDDSWWDGWLDRFTRLHAEAKRRNAPPGVLRAFHELGDPNASGHAPISMLEANLDRALTKWVARLEAEAVEAWRS